MSRKKLYQQHFKKEYCYSHQFTKTYRKGGRVVRSLFPVDLHKTTLSYFTFCGTWDGYWVMRTFFFISDRHNSIERSIEKEVL